MSSRTTRGWLHHQLPIQTRWIWLAGLCLSSLGLLGCQDSPGTSAPSSAPAPTGWLGIPSAINYIVNALHDGTGWLLNKSQVSIKKSGDIRPSETGAGAWEADFQITVEYGNESFETTAQNIPCDQDGIPTEASIDRLRTAVEDIKTKMKRLQN
jgi:hypothetical protein